MCLDVVDDLGHGLVNTALQIHWVGTGGDVLQTLCDDSLSQDGSCGGTVAGVVTRLAGYALDELSASVLELILKFYLFGDGDTVLGDLRSTEFLLDDDVAALRTECNLYGVGQLVNTSLDEVAGFCIVFNNLCHCYEFLSLL